MPLPPIKISDKVQKAAYDDLARGAMRKFGDALAVIADRIVNLHFKSPEERALDWQTGSEESENRRRLAAEALDRVPPERRIFPAPQIMGPIFRDSEFELPGTPIWELWSQLLSRGCDEQRAHEAHPAFPTIIAQLSYEEALLLRVMHRHRKTEKVKYSTLVWHDGKRTRVDTHPSPEWAGRVSGILDLHFAAAHLSQMGLVALSGATSHHPRQGEPGTQTYGQFAELMWWGVQFMDALTCSTDLDE